MFLQNFGISQQNHTAPKHKTPPLPWKPQISNLYTFHIPSKWVTKYKPAVDYKLMPCWNQYTVKSSSLKVNLMLPSENMLQASCARILSTINLSAAYVYDTHYMLWSFNQTCHATKHTCLANRNISSLFTPFSSFSHHSLHWVRAERTWNNVRLC